MCFCFINPPDVIVLVPIIAIYTKNILMENLGSPLFVGPRSDDPIPPILTREISNYESLVN